MLNDYGKNFAESEMTNSRDQSTNKTAYISMLNNHFEIIVAQIELDSGVFNLLQSSEITLNHE